MKSVSRNRLVTAWTSFITTTAIFMLIGFLIFFPDSGEIPWWCWFVPALTLVEAVRATIQYIAGEHTRVCPNCQEKTSISSQFCEKCGYDLRAVTYQNYGKVETSGPELKNSEEPPKPIQSSNNYCATCGGPLSGSEQYCPTCGMPLRQ
jgi:hypothetical protein